MDRRLQRRYVELVKAHMHTSPPVEAGAALRGGLASGFSATQAVWRFLNNERVSLTALVEPLREQAARTVTSSGDSWALLIHDWSKLDYHRHASKRDVVQLTHATDVGYELTTALLVSGSDGVPIAPLEMHLKTAEGFLSTRVPSPPRDAHHLAQVLPTMQAADGWGLSCGLVHVIDREADSVGHFRQWDAAGPRFLVRADDRRVRWEGRSALLSEVVQSLEENGVFRDVREVTYQGRSARQWVAQTTLVLHRPATHWVGDRQREVAGRPLELRLVVARVCDDRGKVQAQWLLLTNVPTDAAGAAVIALWYYWRWRIESFFKLLKSSGQSIEQWQQETGMAIARRLLVAAMACVVVWQLQRNNTPQAVEMKRLLVRLSGRAMKRTRPVTDPALLAGLYVLLAILDLLDHEDTDLNTLRQLAQQTLHFFDTG